MNLKRHQIVTSKVWLDENNQPLKLKIMRLTKGLVYYRPFYGWASNGINHKLGEPCVIDRADVDKWIVNEDKIRALTPSVKEQLKESLEHEKEQADG